MSRAIAVLRPEPGNAATVAGLRAVGLEPVSLPLFQVVPLAWQPPQSQQFDGLLLTSANAIRHGGGALATLRSLPVIAVGEATANAAREAGFTIERAGTSDVATLLNQIGTDRRLLWLAGADRTAIAHCTIAGVIAVYEAAAVPIPTALVTALHGGIALLHSTRAAQRWAQLVDRAGLSRLTITLVAISAKVAAAAGAGWAGVAVADSPTDDAMIATAQARAIDP